jgi:hypothetical protein
MANQPVANELPGFALLAAPTGCRHGLRRLPRFRVFD